MSPSTPASESRHPRSRARPASSWTVSSSAPRRSRSPRRGPAHSATSSPRCGQPSTLSEVSRPAQGRLTCGGQALPMSLTTIILLNTILDLAVVLAVFAIVRLTHRLHRYEHRPETLHP